MATFFAAVLTSVLDPAVIGYGLVAALCWREGWKLAAGFILVAGAAALTAAIEEGHRIPLGKGLAWALIVARSIAGGCWAAVIVWAIGYWRRTKPD